MRPGAALLLALPFAALAASPSSGSTPWDGPAFAAGAVVEETLVYRHHHPAIGSSERISYYFGGGAPTRRSRIALEAPVRLPLAYAIQGTGAQPVVADSGGRKHVALELRDLP